MDQPHGEKCGPYSCMHWWWVLCLARSCLPSCPTRITFCLHSNRSQRQSVIARSCAGAQLRVLIGSSASLACYRQYQMSWYHFYSISMDSGVKMGIQCTSNCHENDRLCFHLPTFTVYLPACRHSREAGKQVYLHF